MRWNCMNQFDKICKDIKDVKIQGAENVALAALKALEIKHDFYSIKKLLSLRPTEPMLRNAIDKALRSGVKETRKLFIRNEMLIANLGADLIKNDSVVYTHCHSSTVIRIFEEAKKQDKKFKVLNTETRPLFQGRRTSLDLLKLNIENYHFVDSAMRQAIKHADLILLGADSITDKKVFNKIGSELVCEVAERFNKPVYICSSSWKFDVQSLKEQETPIEFRDENEVWKNHPRNIHIVNPAFEKINPVLIKGVVCELGVLPFRRFVAKAKEEISK